MKTKNIFKALALAILMPALLLNTACNSDIINNENTDGKGFALPVTVNVTRQGDDLATKATFDGSKLNFSAGDKLFVKGTHTTAGQFAGTLTWTSGGIFSGTITTQYEYTGTADALFTAASTASATLLPDGYGTYGFLSITANSGYDATVATNYLNAFATSKAAAVEQLSYEAANSYSSGFVLNPANAILNFTITGLPASTEVAVVMKKGQVIRINKSLTTDGSGTATFAVGMYLGMDLNDYTLTVGGKAITLVSSSKVLSAGKIYNITRSALTYPIALSAVTSSYVGSVVTTDGNVYATVAAASAASKTAVAVIAYVGTAGSVDASSATYKGLAVALSDANSGSKCKWADGLANCLSSSQTDAIATALGFKNGITCTSTLTAAGHSSHGHAAATAAASNNSTDAPTGTSGWFMPSMGQWNLIVQGLATKKAGSAVTTDLEKNTKNDTYKADNLNSVITDAGGTGFQEDSYWASTEETTGRAWVIDFWGGYAIGYSKNNTNHYVRSIIAF